MSLAFGKKGIIVDFCSEILVGEMRAEAWLKLIETLIGNKKVETMNEHHSLEWKMKKNEQ